MTIAASTDLIEWRDLPAAHGTLPDGLAPIPGGWTERTWTFEGRPIRLTLPASPDAFLDDPSVQEAHERTEYMPYWAYLWPSALHMARMIRRADWPVDAEVLELGSGIGLAGVAALSRGNPVTFNDYEPQAVQLSLHNARQNGWGDRAAGDVFDWRQPPARRFPIILGCEVIYEDRNHEPILRLLQGMLSPGGRAWFGDGGRWRAERFARLLPEYGFEYHLLDELGEPLPAPRAGRFQLFVVRRRDAS
jgi:predicted nicotinamide N-methyase